MSQVAFTDIKEIFPSTKTDTINKLITENSITRMINRLLDVDSYVISSEFPEGLIASNITQSNNNDYILIANGIQETALEFCIRGYYFNLNKYEDFYVDGSPGKLENKGDRLAAVIYISTDPNYPEIYGQDSIEGKEIDRPSDASSTITFPSECTNSNVSDIKLINSEGGEISDYTDLNLNEDHQLRSGESETALTWSDTGAYRVLFVLTTVKTCLFLTTTFDGTDTPTIDQNDNPPGDGYEPHSLVLYEKVGDGEYQYAIPLSSLHKFDTISISTIDGGVVETIE